MKKQTDARRSKSNLLASLGDVIRYRRNELGLSQEALAEKADFDRTYISMIERGRRNISLLNLEILAKALHCKCSDLLSDAEHAA